MRLILHALLLLSLASPAFAQGVFGAVADSSGRGLSGASLILTNRESRGLSGFTTSDLRGNFRLPDVVSGAYEIRVSFIGFETATLPLDVPEGTAPLDLGTIRLKTRVAPLGQLEVTARRPPVVVRGDTLVYDAASVEVGPGASVETLLDELPGIEVEDDGTVRAQGRVVDRVTVDGRDFFGRSPTAATRNLPADAVERVEVFDERQTNGVDGNRTLNLVLREDRRRRTFGRAEGGGGADVAADPRARYAGRASVNRFRPGLRVSAIGSLNNLNEPGMTSREYFGLVGSGNAQTGDIIRLDGAIPLAGDAVTGFASSWTGGATVSIGDGPGWTANASYIGYASRTASASETDLERRGAGTAALNESESVDGNSSAFVHRMEARADRIFGDDHSLRLNAALSAQEHGDRSERTRDVFDQPALGSSFAYRTSLGGESARLGAVYERRLGRAWLLRAEFDGALGRRRERADIDCLACASVPPPAGIPVRRTEQGVSARTDFSRPLGRAARLRFRLSRTFGVETQNRVDTGLDIGELPDISRTDSETSSGGILELGNGALRGSIGADLALVHRREGELRANSFVLPTGTLNYTWAPSRTARLRYAARREPPSAYQLHAVPTLLGPFQLHVGAPGLRDAISHSASAQYLNVGVVDGSSLFLFASGRYSRNALSFERSTEEGGVIRVTPVQVDDGWSLNASVSHERLVLSTSMATRATLSGRLSGATDVLNSELDPYTLGSVSSDGRLRLRAGSLRRSQVGVRATLQWLSYGRELGQSRTDLRMRPYSRLAARIGESTLMLSLEHDIRLRSRGESARTPLLDLEATHPVAGRFEARLAVLDILNTGLQIETDVNPGMVEVNRTETLGRRIIFRLSSTF